MKKTKPPTSVKNRGQRTVATTFLKCHVYSIFTEPLTKYKDGLLFIIIGSCMLLLGLLSIKEVRVLVIPLIIFTAIIYATWILIKKFIKDYEAREMSDEPKDIQRFREKCRNSRSNDSQQTIQETKNTYSEANQEAKDIQELKEKYVKNNKNGTSQQNKKTEERTEAPAEPTYSTNKYTRREHVINRSDEVNDQGRNRPQVISEESIKLIEWKRFEILCCEFLKLAGYDARETSYGADGGIDITIHRENENRPFAVVQCKRWKTNQVGVKEIRALNGVMAMKGIEKGIFITASDFFSNVYEEAKQTNIQLINGKELVGIINKLPTEKLQWLIDIIFKGDYETPTCSRCGIPMVMKTGKDGKPFWGCKNFSRFRNKCRNTLNVNA